MVLCRNLSAFRHNFPTFALGMVRVARTKQSPARWRGFKQHAVSTLVRRAIRDAVDREMRVDTRPLVGQTLGRKARLNLFQGEIGRPRMFAMQEGCRDPHFIRHSNPCGAPHVSSTDQRRSVLPHQMCRAQLWDSAEASDTDSAPRRCRFAGTWATWIQCSAAYESVPV